MPDVNWNSFYWDGKYDWTHAGEEWSRIWGGSEAQWFGSLFPRLHRFLPTGRILEIAPGYGRWTKFLIPACSNYLGIDLSAECVKSCADLFSSTGNAVFVQNDGLSLDAVPDNSIDFVFSFDSLVHAEIEVLRSYVPQIMKKLSPDGVAFLHHSNLKALPEPRASKLYSRAASVSGHDVAGLVLESGGRMIIQEIIDWRAVAQIDCLTTFGKTKEGSAAAVALTNDNFMKEASFIQTFQSPYSKVK